jgi:kynurenine 3-monooxygenase
MSKILITGGGLVGTLLAMYLSKRGNEVDVFERHPDLRQASIRSSSSINLTLCERGLKSLAGVGLGREIYDLAIPAYGRLIHSQEGELTYQPYGNNQEAIYSISRSDLNIALIDFAERHFDINFHFNKKCVGLNLNTLTAQFEDTMDKRVSSEQADIVFGADGAYSAIRFQLQKTNRFNFSQQYWEQGYKELKIPPTADGKWALEKNVLHIWPRGNYMLIGFPNRDGSFTCALHIPFEGELSYESIKTEADLRSFFEEAFPDVVERIPNLVEDFFSRTLNSMVTVRCNPWSFNDRVILIGDAAHAIYPSYGQGANAGFEDCATLDRCIEKYGQDWQAVFREYEKVRKPNTDAIADLCIEHFIEIRDLVGDPQFLLRKQIERKLNQLSPERYASLYSMITFTCLPYTEARRIDREQSVLVDKIMNIEGIEDKLDDPDIESLLGDWLRKSQGMET